jgi:CBS domain-containing protein
MRKPIRELPDLNKPITVQADTKCSDAVRVMKKEGIDQMPVVQPFPGGKVGEEEVIAVISLSALSKNLLHDPELIEGPVMQFASQKYVVVEPTATISSVTDALEAFLDRGGDSGVVIIAEDRGGKKLLRHIVSRIDLLAYETETVSKSKK